MQVILNSDFLAWVPPPPEPPPIDILDAGVGTHLLWGRALDFVGEVFGNSSTNDLTGETLGAIRGGIYFRVGSAIPERLQVKNISGLPGLNVGIDYYSKNTQRNPITQWQVAVGGSGNPAVNLGGSGSCDVYAYGYPANTLWGLGDLGVLLSGFGPQENYYSLCGDCAFGGGPGGGGGAGGGDQEPVLGQPRPQIIYQDKDITDLVERAHAAASTIENLSIVGSGVSGNPKEGFAINIPASGEDPT